MGSRGPVSEQECRKIWILGIFAYMLYRRPTITVFALLKQHNMDTTSSQEAAPTPNWQFDPQEPVDFSIDDLLKRVEEFQKRQQLETLERITTENSWLEFHIARHQQNSTRTMNLLQEIYNAVMLMQEALEKYRLEEVKADQAWLAFWGIRERPNVTPGTHQAGWI
jgi:hypothetical protein